MDWVWMSSFTRSAGAPALCVVVMRRGQQMKGLGFTELGVADTMQVSFVEESSYRSSSQ